MDAGATGAGSPLAEPTGPGLAGGALGDVMTIGEERGTAETTGAGLGSVEVNGAGRGAAGAGLRSV